MLFHFLDDFILRRRRVAVVNNQLHPRAHGRGVGEATGLALTHIKRWLSQVVFGILHLDKSIVRDDGEGGVERGLQAFVGSLFRIAVRLQKRGVRVFLHLQQVRDFQHAVAVTKILADAFTFSKVVGHSISGQNLRSL